MLRISFFVDFSNLLGSLGKINLKVDDYEHFFAYLAEQVNISLKSCVISPSNKPDAILSRVYWYAVGKCDYYNFDDNQTIDYFKKIFNENREIKTSFVSTLGKANTGMPQAELAKKAENQFIADRKNWYIERCKKIKGFCDFYDMVRRQCDFIEIDESGYWRLDFISKDVDEKGIDTALAVDSVTISDTFDVAVIVSGDADMIPSAKYLKRQGKYVGTISFIKGYPPEKKGRQQSKRLSLVADFNTQIYEMDLNRMEFVHPLNSGESII